MLERFRESKAWKWTGDISVLQWVITSLLGVSGTLTALVRRVPIHWAILIGAGIFALLMIGVNQLHEWKLKRQRGMKESLIDVSLKPSEGPSDKMLLAVTNNGKGQKFHAQCVMLARRNDPNKLFQKPYDLPWEDHMYRHATIVHGESRNLLVARADENRQSKTAEVSLIERQAGGDKKTVEWSRWDRNRTGPEYDLEVSIFGEGDGEPYRERFTLRCGGKTSALEMVGIEQEEAEEDTGPDLSLEWNSTKTYPNYDRIRLRNVGTSSAFNIGLHFVLSELSFSSKFELNVLHANQEIEREVTVFERTNGHSNLWRMEYLLTGNHLTGKSPIEVVATFFGAQREAFEKSFSLELGSAGERVKIIPGKRKRLQAAS